MIKELTKKQLEAAEKFVAGLNAIRSANPEMIITARLHQNEGRPYFGRKGDSSTIISENGFRTDGFSFTFTNEGGSIGYRLHPDHYKSDKDKEILKRVDEMERNIADMSKQCEAMRKEVGRE